MSEADTFLAEMRECVAKGCRKCGYQGSRGQCLIGMGCNVVYCLDRWREFHETTSAKGGNA